MSTRCMEAPTILSRLEGVQEVNGGWECHCPAHDDQRSSLSVGVGDDGRTLVCCHAGCSAEQTVSAVGMAMKDLMPVNSNGAAQAAGRPKIVKTYNYVSEAGKLLYQVVRFEPKGFRQRQPKPGGGWNWRVKGVQRVLYNLPTLVAADVSELVFISEGEKDADNLANVGIVATTNVGGAKKWSKSYSTALKGRNVIILPDNDEPGRKHAEAIARSLHGVAASVRMLELPDLPDKGDVSDWLVAGGTREELLRLAKEAPEWEPSEGESPETDRAGKPTITISVDERCVVDQAIAALAAATDENVFQRGGLLVHIVRDAPSPRGIALPEDAPRISPLKPARLQEVLASVALWEQWVSESETELRHPPAWAVKAVMARDHWPDIQRITGIVETPVLRADGTILQSIGYDAATGLVYEPQVTFPVVADRPTQTDANRARDELIEVVADFPFASSDHRSAWLASTITPLARYAYHGPAPLFVVDANVRGCGKSLLTDATGTIVSGREMARMPAPRDDDEFRKRITALAVAGTPLVLLDNVSGALGSPSLDAALTATSWSDRMLGLTEICTLPLAMTWFATGNNIILQADTVRRTLHIRLESSEENPEERSGFRHPDLLRWVRGERPRLAAAAVTILAGYCAAGRPDVKLTPWGSFEGWSDLVRQAVVWCGLPDPGETRSELTAHADREAAALRQLIDGWQEADPHGHGMTVSAALKLLADYPHEYETLRSAIVELVYSRDGKFPGPRSIGMKLHHLRRRVIGGKCLDKRDVRQGALWFVLERPREDRKPCKAGEPEECGTSATILAMIEMENRRGPGGLILPE